jgi:hypothetical protein
MPSDIEIDDSDSAPAPYVLNIDPIILASVTPAPERVVYKYKEYLRRPGLRNTEIFLVIWSIREEYERNKNKFWRCGIYKITRMLVIDNGTSSAIRHLKKDYKINKKGRRILIKLRTII